MKMVFSILVENTLSVLSHVSGLFSRRGYNIHSISAGVTADPRYTRITIVAEGDELILEQIEKQLAKLEDIIDVKKLLPGNSVTRELMLVKVAAGNDELRQSLVTLVELYHAKVVDVTKEALIIEINGTSSKLEAFLEMLSDYEILELARTGITGLSRGTDDVKYL